MGLFVWPGCWVEKLRGLRVLEGLQKAATWDNCAMFLLPMILRGPANLRSSSGRVSVPNSRKEKSRTSGNVSAADGVNPA